MSESSTSHSKTFAMAILPIFILLAIDFFSTQLVLTKQSMFIVAMLSAQLLIILVFAKGEICPGQTGRLKKINLYWLIFWVIEIAFSVTQQDGITMKSSLLGLACWYCLAKQPTERLRQIYLINAAIFSVLGIALAVAPTFSIAGLLKAQPIVQLLIGVILCALALNLSRNRLKGFIALLPLLMAVFLALNAIANSVLLALLYQQSPEFMHNEFALLLYFVLHFAIAGMVLFHIFKQQTLDYLALTALLFLSATLPIWMQFAFFME